MILLLALPAAAQRDTQKEERSRHVRQVELEARDTYRDIEATLGSVPRFFRAFPDWAIPGAWAEMKGLQLSDDTALAPKEKELIGLAVSAQIPCRYCIYFHTQVARLKGATDDEIDHAIAEASLTRQDRKSVV